MSDFLGLNLRVSRHVWVEEGLKAKAPIATIYSK